MNGNPLQTRLRNGDPLLGFYHGYPAESILETIGRGWDFVWIDAQHGQFSTGSALRSVRMADALELAPVLRVPTHEAGWLGVYADMSPAAIMIPKVDTPTAAAAIVNALRFPPLGERSFGGRRPVDVHGREYHITHEPMLIVQIETMKAMQSVTDIACMEGIDALFLGIDDLKLSLELPINTPLHECDALNKSVQRIADVCRSAGKWCGVPIATPDEIPVVIELGFQLICCGSDVGFLRSKSRQQLEECRRKLSQLSSDG